MTSNAHPETRILGNLRSADGQGVVRMEDRYDTDIDDLWSAITDPRRLARWYGQVEGDLRPGGEFHGRLEFWEGTGRVKACEPLRRLLVTTRGVDEPYDEVIEATLTADGDQTILVIETRGMPPDLIAAYGPGCQRVIGLRRRRAGLPMMCAEITVCLNAAEGSPRPPACSAAEGITRRVACFPAGCRGPR